MERSARVVLQMTGVRRAAGDRRPPKFHLALQSARSVEADSFQSLNIVRTA